MSKIKNNCCETCTHCDVYCTKLNMLTPLNSLCDAYEIRLSGKDRTVYGDYLKGLSMEDARKDFLLEMINATSVLCSNLNTLDTKEFRDEVYFIRRMCNTFLQREDYSMD